MTIELVNVMISGFSTHSGGDRPSESITLNFTKVTYKGVQMAADGVRHDQREHQLRFCRRQGLRRSKFRQHSLGVTRDAANLSIK